MTTGWVVAPLLAGLSALVVAWSSLVKLSAPGPFSAHMADHLILVAVAAPLIGVAVARGTPALAAGAARLCSPLAASALEFVVVWAWHAPALHQAARLGLVPFMVEQALFLGSGLLLWVTALARPLAGIVALLVTAGHMTLLGVLLALSPRHLFALTHGATAVLPSPTYDQELGGVLMLTVGGTVYLIGGLGLLAGLLHPTQPQRR